MSIFLTDPRTSTTQDPVCAWDASSILSTVHTPRARRLVECCRPRKILIDRSRSKASAYPMSKNQCEVLDIFEFISEPLHLSPFRRQLSWWAERIDAVFAPRPKSFIIIRDVPKGGTLYLAQDSQDHFIYVLVSTQGECEMEVWCKRRSSKSIYMDIVLFLSYLTKQYMKTTLLWTPSCLVAAALHG